MESLYDINVTRVGDENFLLESSVGGKAMFRCVWKDARRTGEFVMWDPIDHNDARNLLGRSFWTMHTENASRFEFNLPDPGNLFGGRIAEHSLFELFANLFDKKREFRKTFFAAKNMDRLVADMIYETNRRPHGTPSLKTVGIMKELAAGGVDWYESLYREGGRKALTEKAWQQILSAFGSLTIEEVGVSGAEFLIGVSTSYTTPESLVDIAIGSIKKLVGNQKEQEVGSRDIPGR